MEVGASEVDGHLWFTSTTFSPPTASSVHSPAKRPRLTQPLSFYQLKRLGVQRHDGRVPKSLYGYRLEGRKLALTEDPQHKTKVERIQQHLSLLHHAIKPWYKSMSPLNLTESQCESDYAVHCDLGLVYRVLRQTSDSIICSLVYSFYMPLPFLVFPQADSNEVDYPDPRSDHDVDLYVTATSDPELCESDRDEVDGLFVQSRLEHIVCFACRSVPSPNSEPYKMFVNEYGDITCSGVESSYLPAQFEVVHDSQNTTLSYHVVSIRARGFGPDRSFFVALTNKEKRFTVEKAEDVMKSYSVPKDKKFHFVMTGHSGGYRFQAITGDHRYLAFESVASRRGAQVTVTEKNVKSKLLNTVFDFL